MFLCFQFYGSKILGDKGIMSSDSENFNPTLDLKFKPKVVNDGKTKIVETYQDPSINYRNVVKITTKDILTAFDGTKSDTIFLSKEKTNQTCNVFRYLEKKGIKTSFLKQIDDKSFLSKQTTILPYECVVRRKAYGSFLKRHPEVQSGNYFHIPVIEFFSKLTYSPPCLSHENLHAILDSPRLMDENKAREYYLRDGQWIHPVETDPMILFNFHEWRLNGEDKNSKDGFKLDVYSAKKPQNSNQKLMQIDSSITVQEYMDIVDLMKNIFGLLESAWKKFEIELIDLKIEVGYDYDEGKLIVSDVIDNDSWRLWPNGDQTKQLDKQAYRENSSFDEVIEKYKKVTHYTSLFND